MKKILLILLFFVAIPAHAQTWTTAQQYMNQGQSNQLSQFQVKQSGTNLTYTPLEPLYPYQAADINTPGGFVSLLNNIFRLLISLGALIAVVTLVVGGIAYMVSEAIDKKQEAKNRMKASIYGLLLLAGSYLILNTINPDLLRINLNPGTISDPNAQTPQSGSNSGNGNANTPTQVVVRPITLGESRQISDGSEAADILMNYNSQCQLSEGAMIARERGDGYTTWTCQ